MTDKPDAPAPTACTHRGIMSYQSEGEPIAFWGCVDCQRRFYPACEKCVSVGHRGGFGEHVSEEAAARDTALREALIDALRWDIGSWHDGNPYAPGTRPWAEYKADAILTRLVDQPAPPAEGKE